MQEIKLSVPQIGLSMFAMCLLGAGILGLAEPDVVPHLGESTVAWALIATGVMFEMMAMGGLYLAVMSHARDRAAPAAPGDGAS